MFGKFDFMYSKNSFALFISFPRREACRATRFTVAPYPSQADFPCEVSKKFHSNLIPSYSCYLHRLKSVNLFLYCPGHPSEKYFMCLTFGRLLLIKSIIPILNR